MSVYKVGIGDVVRVTRTGRLGTVAGMASVTANRSVVSVDVGAVLPVTVIPAELEFVADAKIPASKSGWAAVAVLVSIATSFVANIPLWHTYHVAWPYLVSNSVFVYVSMDRMFSRLLRPRKLRVL